MKDKRIWIVIGCILVMGTGVTHYTKYYVKSQASAIEETAAETAGDILAGVPAPASTPEVQERELEGGMAAEKAVALGRSLSSAPAAVTGSAPSFQTDGTEEAALAGTLAAAQDTPVATEAAAAEVPQIYSEDEVPVEAVPISPLTGARSADVRSKLIVDYRQRLMDLDGQIQRMRKQETDSNVYSIKTSAETELKMWDSEMNTIYNALLEVLSEEDASKLAAQQREWMKARDAKAAEGSGKSSASVESIGYAAAMASLIRDRAYELAEGYEDAYGVQIVSEEETPTTVSGQ